MSESLSPSQIVGGEKSPVSSSDSQEMPSGAVGAHELTQPQEKNTENPFHSETTDHSETIGRYLDGWERRLRSLDSILNPKSKKYLEATVEERLSAIDVSLKMFDRLCDTFQFSPAQQARAQEIRQEIVALKEALNQAETPEPTADATPETPAATSEQDQKERDQAKEHWSQFYHQAFNELKQKVDQLDPTAKDYPAQIQEISKQVWQLVQGVIARLSLLNDPYQEYDISLWVPGWARNFIQKDLELRQKTTSKTAPVDAEAAPPPSQATETPVNKQDQATYEENRQKWASAKPEYDLQNIHFLESTFYDFLAEKKVPFKQRREIVEMVFHDLGHYNGLINDINKMWQSKLAKARRRRDIARGA